MDVEKCGIAEKLQAHMYGLGALLRQTITVFLDHKKTGKAMSTFSHAELNLHNLAQVHTPEKVRWNIS